MEKNRELEKLPFLLPSYSIIVPIITGATPKASVLPIHPNGSEWS
jgi:hypothetical protein